MRIHSIKSHVHVCTNIFIDEKIFFHPNFKIFQSFSVLIKNSEKISNCFVKYNLKKIKFIEYKFSTI